MHLIGHSFGANVVTTAALALTTPPRQLTLLDSPEVELARIGGAKNDLQYKLPRLDLGRGPNQTFVDNYISAGRRALLDRPRARRGRRRADQATRRHRSARSTRFAIVWYTDSVAATGQPTPHVGYGWSPLTGADVASVGPPTADLASMRRSQLDEVAGPPPANVTDQLAVGADAARRDRRRAPGLDRLGDRGRPRRTLTFTTTDDSLWLTFDTRARAAARATCSTLFVDGRERSQVGVPADGHRRGRVVRHPLRPRARHPRPVGRRSAARPRSAHADRHHRRPRSRPALTSPPPGTSPATSRPPRPASWPSGSSSRSWWRR